MAELKANHLEARKQHVGGKREREADSASDSDEEPRQTKRLRGNFRPEVSDSSADVALPSFKSTPLPRVPSRAEGHSSYAESAPPLASSKRGREDGSASKADEEPRQTKRLRGNFRQEVSDSNANVAFAPFKSTPLLQVPSQVEDNSSAAPPLAGSKRGRDQFAW